LSEAKIMNKPVTLPQNGTTRRDLVVGASLVGGALLVGCSPTDILNLGAKKIDFGAFGPFIKIGADGAVTVISKHIEFGQGTHAGLAAIVAEELDADWSRVLVEQSPANTKVYQNLLFGAQGTGGSTAIANSWMQLRQAGASARAMFVQAASTKWGVPAAEITVKDSVVSHASGKSASFADLLKDAAKVAPPAAPVLKDPKNFTLIGTQKVRRKDSLAKSTGKAVYTQDIDMPGMLTAMVAHPPRFGAKVASYDDTEAKKVKGVVKIFKIATGVAVVAENTWAAKQGRDALKVTWDESKAEMRSSPEIVQSYAKLAAARSDGVAFETKGDATKAFGGPLHEAKFDFPYLAHACMEPMNCVAQVDGQKVKLTYGCQGPTMDQVNVAKAIGVLPGSIEIETLTTGGSFGRRATVDGDYVVECARIAKKIGGFIPVKLVWTREDDMLGGQYRPMVHHNLAIKIGADGYPAAWRHTVVTQSIMKGSPMPQGKFEAAAVEGAHGSPYLKATPVVDAQVIMAESPVTVLWWRSVGGTHTALVMEHTIDQLAAKAGKDPVEYRRALYTKADAKRHLAVMDLATQKAGWGKPLPAGTARGIAVHESFGSVVAQVAEVSIIDGVPKVSRVVCAVDCGIAISPDQIAAQMEGSVAYGLSAALYGEITLKDGLVEQHNFDTYRVMRQNEAPMVETYIVPSGANPSGIGEPGTPPIAPAVANALLALTGKPTSSLPFVKA
jgi:isoquinoline 1-oxidoreductase beta subunit